MQSFQKPQTLLDFVLPLKCSGQWSCFIKINLDSLFPQCENECRQYILTFPVMSFPAVWLATCFWQHHTWWKGICLHLDISSILKAWAKLFYYVWSCSMCSSAQKGKRCPPNGLQHVANKSKASSINVSWSCCYRNIYLKGITGAHRVTSKSHCS